MGRGPNRGPWAEHGSWEDRWIGQFVRSLAGANFCLFPGKKVCVGFEYLPQGYWRLRELLFSLLSMRLSTVEQKHLGNCLNFPCPLPPPKTGPRSIKSESQRGGVWHQPFFFFPSNIFFSPIHPPSPLWQSSGSLYLWVCVCFVCSFVLGCCYLHGKGSGPLGWGKREVKRYCYQEDVLT